MHAMQDPGCLIHPDAALGCGQCPALVRGQGWGSRSTETEQTGWPAAHACQAKPFSRGPDRCALQAATVPCLFTKPTGQIPRYIIASCSKCHFITAKGQNRSISASPCCVCVCVTMCAHAGCVCWRSRGNCVLSRLRFCALCVWLTSCTLAAPVQCKLRGDAVMQ